MSNLNRKQAPQKQAVKKVEIIKATEQKLDNNIPVYTINAGTEDIIKINFVFEAGTWLQNKPLIATTASAMIDLGTLKFSSKDIAEKFDFFGAYLDLSCGKHYSKITVYTLTRYFEAIVEILEDIIKHPTFPDDEFKVLNQKRKQDYFIEIEKVEFQAHKHFFESMIGKSHPYARLAMPEDYDDPQLLENIRKFYKDHYFSNNCKIIVAGKINSQIIPVLNRFFGKNDWSSDKKPHYPKYIIQPDENKKQLIHKEGAVQAAVRMGQLSINKMHPDFPALKVLTTVLGGYFGSRLMKSIREEKGYTYGIYSILASLKETGYIAIASGLNSDTSELAVEEIYKEINKLRNEKIGEEELQIVKNVMLSEFLRYFDGPFGLSDTFMSLLEYNLDYSYYDNFIRTIEEVTAEQLHNLANKYLCPDEFYEVLVK